MDQDLIDMLNQSISKKLEGSILGLKGNIDIHLAMTNLSEIEHARNNGFIAGLNICKGMLEAILRLEEARKELNE